MSQKMSQKKFVPPEEIADRLDCINRNIARFRIDIRQIVREEMKSVVEEVVKDEQARRRERCW